MWSRNYATCQHCGTTDHAYMAKGLCSACYLAAYRASHGERISKQKDEWYRRYHADNLLKRAAYRRESQYSGLWDAIIDRDGHQCVRCHSTLNLVVHHKDRSGRGKAEHNNDPANLETLCRRCHLAEHRAEHPQKQPRRPSGRWSLKYDQCRQCGTNTIHHRAFGLCRTCYQLPKRRAVNRRE